MPFCTRAAGLNCPCPPSFAILQHDSLTSRGRQMTGHVSVPVPVARFVGSIHVAGMLQQQQQHPMMWMWRARDEAGKGGLNSRITASWAGEEKEREKEKQKEKGRLASAAGLVMGTAVGPGILGLPAATLHAGLVPSTATILVAWAYVMASILLVAELSYAVMEETGGSEVSFAGLAEKTLGKAGAVLVSAVYAMLNYALLVACMAGLGSVLSARFKGMPWAVMCLLSPGVVAASVGLGSFTAVDLLNRLLCVLMLASITSLVAVGIRAGQHLLPAALSRGVWTPEAMLLAAPVTVLTLGFHSITPLVCKVVGGRPQDARTAILCGGAVPLAMVLAWSTVIHILSAHAPTTSKLDPISLLLSVSSSAAPVVQAFAFSALGTTLIGYSLSFPKHLADTASLLHHLAVGAGPSSSSSTTEAPSSRSPFLASLALALAPPAAVAVLYPTAFQAALTFAGVYANSFLFGLLPPIMVWRHRYYQRVEEQQQIALVPGGRWPLLLLTAVAFYLGSRPVG